MSFLSIFFTGIGLAMDAFAVSIAQGIALKKVEVKEALRIALYFAIFQGIMPFLGWSLGVYFQDYIKSIDHWIAFVLLGILGGKMIWESFKKDKEEDGRENLETKQLIILSIATSIDALAVGVGFAFLSVSIVPSIIIIALITFVLCLIAVLIGKKLSGIFQNYAELLGGIILILIGINILLEHTNFFETML